MSDIAAVTATDAGSAPASTEVPPVNPVDSGTTEPAGTSSEPAVIDEGSAPLGEKGQKELIALRKRAQEAENQNIYLRAMLERGQQPTDLPGATPPAGSPKPDATLQPPKLDDFETFEEYEAAKDQYLIEKAKVSIKADLTQQTVATQVSRVEQAWNERLEKESKEDPTLINIINDQTLTINPHMAAIIKSSEMGVKILKHLDQNREVALHIARLHPIQAAVEMGKLEARLSAAPPPESPRKVSQAPEPIKPVNAIGTPVVDENNLSTDEWIRRRNAEQFKFKQKE